MGLSNCADDLARGQRGGPGGESWDGELSWQVCWLEESPGWPSGDAVWELGREGLKLGSEVRQQESHQDSKMWLEDFNQEGH